MNFIPWTFLRHTHKYLCTSVWNTDFEYNPQSLRIDLSPLFSTVTGQRSFLLILFKFIWPLTPIILLCHHYYTLILTKSNFRNVVKFSAHTTSTDATERCSSVDHSEEEKNSSNVQSWIKAYWNCSLRFTLNLKSERINSMCSYITLIAWWIHYSIYLVIEYVFTGIYTVL